MRAFLLAILIAWTWTADNGTQHWVDDAEKIPAAYRAQAVEVQIGPLSEYPRYTGPDARLEGDEAAK